MDDDQGLVLAATSRPPTECSMRNRTIQIQTHVMRKRYQIVCPVDPPPVIFMERFPDQINFSAMKVMLFTNPERQAWFPLNGSTMIQ